MSDTIKFPIVLPKKRHITDLIIKHCHDQVEHQRRGMTLNEVRSRGFWVIGGSTAVAKCISVLRAASLEEQHKNKGWWTSQFIV